MPDYYAAEFFDLPSSRRFPDWAIAVSVWREFGDGIPETLRTILDELVRRRRTAHWGHVPLKCPRVFISHQRADKTRALDIARLAKLEGFDVWLDVLEPALNFPTSPAPTPQQKSLAVATIVEMGLLNCTHVLAVMTTAAERSRWVPYEYGRVKDSSPYSLSAACWIDSQLATARLPEYLLLGPMTYSDPEISKWLKTELIAWQSVYPGCGSRSVANDPNAIDPTSTGAEPPQVVRDSMEEDLRLFSEGHPDVITLLRRLRLKSSGSQG